MSKQGVAYIQLAILCAIAGIFCSVAKAYQFSWGWTMFSLFDGSVKTNVNSLWYYTLDSLAKSMIASAFALMTSYSAEEQKGSILMFILKYISISVALLFCCRSTFHFITYNLISIIEMGVDALLLIYATYRAYLWYKTNLTHHKKNEFTTTGSFMGDN
jgi:hypothetical protein